ncbi:hypothetical protein J7438_15660 [Thalassotalea sp. G20_0]|uniref:hypothetical protein n=1 Tax=Thalassotalea sp. G20_0 TaxID=2821093 RepID=UPI001ADA3FD0|nr:hypothetical protein [Thalassotalea sp. G20_0]MBO9495513.1 hypothetical protein [Thalassotalea sp. G20_0]
MNPTTAATEATTQAIERYLADNPGNEPLNALGMTADGRIVRLAEQDEQLRPALQQALERQLEALIPPREDKALWDWIVEDTATMEYQTLENVYADIRRDRKIREKLQDTLSNQADKLEKMHALTTTTDYYGQTRTCGEGNTNGHPWKYRFCNEFTQKHWKFKNNLKEGNINPHEFYMSTVIVWQYLWAFEKKGWLLELPSTIERCSITNPDTNKVLIDHRADYGSEAFCKAFLETTDNGKSTARVAQALGLRIDRLAVLYMGKETGSIDEPLEYDPDYEPFSVVVHVSPDPAVYGAP